MNNKREKLFKAIKADKRYAKFILFETPQKFSKLFKNKAFELVQVHLSQTYNLQGKDYLIGFAGAFKWKDNKITSLDGDSYDYNMLIDGYNYFYYTEDTKTYIGLDILTGDF